jgi:hypothetical protein
VRVTVFLLLLVATPAHVVCEPGRLPLMRGALWWVTAPYYEWSPEQFEETVDAQRAVGFDLLWLFNTPGLVRRAERGEGQDVLEILFALADARGMRVIVDLPKAGWYGETDAAAMIDTSRAFAEAFHDRYGAHPSFHGWYLNHEINPIAPHDAEQTQFWRRAWKGIVDACKQTAPDSIVAISPFFLLDKQRHRGFIYQTPEEYGAWWGETLNATGIDILMLQDSGEHLAFFTLADREPFWAATAKACRAAGAQFWLNVESAEVPAANWEEYLQWEREKTVRYEVVPMDKLAGKLRLAAQYADSIINWGYFPFMNPHEPPVTRVDGAVEAYAAYRAHAQGVLAGAESQGK